LEKLLKGNSQPIVLTQPFPQQQSMVAQTPSPGVNSSHHSNDEASTSAHIYLFNGIDLTTCSTTYDTPAKPDKRKVTNGTLLDPSPSFVSPPSISPPSGSLQIEKPKFESILRSPRSTIHKSTFNPSSRVAQNYNIVEDLAQSSCVMSALEVLQHFPSQRRMLLAAIGTYLESSYNITFNLDNFKSRLSHQIAFQIDVVVHNQQIHRTILDEGASTCVMSLVCWKGLKSPILNKSPTMLHAFDGWGFHPHGLLQSLSVQLGGKTVSVDVEVVDAPLNYNLLLGRSWFYSMTFVASSVFRCVQFPHQGKIVTIDELDFCILDARAPATNNIPFLGDHKITYESVSVGLLKYSTLMGTFPAPLPPTMHHITIVNMISTTTYQSLESFDPWIVPSPLKFNALGDTMPLSPAEASYVVIKSASPSSDDQHLLAPDPYLMPSWLNSLTSAFDYISQIFPSDESIMEILSIDDIPWDDNHHRSSFLPPLEEIQ
jgi:hypothetical protein